MENKNIYEKLSNIQIELKAPKGQYNKFGNYKYRSCEDILEAVKPLCHKNRTTLVLNDEVEVKSERYYIKAIATLYDWDSDNKLVASAYARESLTKKGMDESQITGTSSSYARKYALNGLFNIDDTKDNDTNEAKEQQENAPKIKKITQEQKDIITSYINEFTKPIVGTKIKTTGKKSLGTLTQKEAVKVIQYLRSTDYVETLTKLAREHAKEQDKYTAYINAIAFQKEEVKANEGHS